MKEMWTGIYPNKKEYKYEVRFRTDCKSSYLAVQQACRDEIDGKNDYKNRASYSNADELWLKVRCDDNPQQIFKVTKENPIVEFACRCGNEFAINTADSEWNDCGIITCGCGRKITYEKI